MNTHIRYNTLLTAIFTLLFAALLLPAVHAQSIDVKESSLSVSIHQGEILTRSFQVENTGVTPIELSFSHNLDLTDNDGDSITLSFSDPGIINPGVLVNVTLTIDADDFIDLEDYSGTITVKDKNSSASDTLLLAISVQPDICDFGIVGNDLQLTIEKPDPTDDFNPGDTISIRAEVKNVGNDDIRTSMEAFLFNNDRSIADTSSGDVNIQNGEDEIFHLTIPVPTDPNDVDPDEAFILAIKAFDENDEQLNCVQQIVPIDIKLKNKQLIIDTDNTNLLPQQAQCNDEVLAHVGVINIGDNDLKSVTLGITNPQLGINQQSQPFKVEGFDSNEKNLAMRSFTFTIPTTVKQGLYTLTAFATFDGNKVTSNLPLTILSCPAEEQVITAAPSDVSLSLETSTITAGKGQHQIFARITNHLPVQQTFTIRVTGADHITNAIAQLVTISPGQTRTVVLPVLIDADASSGSYIASVEVVSASQTLLTSKQLTITIPSAPQPAPEEKAFLDQVPTSFWIVVNFTLLALLLLALRVVMLRK